MWYWSANIFSNIDILNSNYVLGEKINFLLIQLLIQTNVDAFHLKLVIKMNSPSGFELKIEYDVEDIDVTYILVKITSLRKIN